jgi:hypothetical protein
MVIARNPAWRDDVAISWDNIRRLLRRAPRALLAMTTNKRQLITPAWYFFPGPLKRRLELYKSSAQSFLNNVEKCSSRP